MRFRTDDLYFWGKDPSDPSTFSEYDNRIHYDIADEMQGSDRSFQYGMWYYKPDRYYDWDVFSSRKVQL